MGSWTRAKAAGGFTFATRTAMFWNFWRER